MYPKLLREARCFQKSQRARAWETYRNLLGRLCQAHRSPVANTIQGFVRNQEWHKLLDYADYLSSQKYDDASQHFEANQFASLIKKYPFPTSIWGSKPLDPESTAREKFYASEQKCKEMNERFIGLAYGENERFQRMRDFIRYVLSDTPSLDDILDGGGFGPGASLGVHGNATNLARKVSSDWSVTPMALFDSFAAVRRNFHLYTCLLETGGKENRYYCFDDSSAKLSFGRRIRIVRHNKIAFVPKTARTHRSIAVEPFLNSYLQKGVDVHMRKRLLRIGIDLSDQEKNKSMARQGSYDDEDGFVTIDLSSASDSISIGLVRSLLPADWFVFLNRIRSHEFMDGKKLFTYHKFCSMGNGFCFPLETLLFVAACHAVGCGRPGKDFSVYGDDIIVRKAYALPLLELLEEMGFAVNAEKTYLSGPFRESCGADWFGGEDVRPFTLDFQLDSIQSFFKFLNLTKRNRLTTQFFAGVREYIISLIPPILRLYRPFEGPADSGITVGLTDYRECATFAWNRRLQCPSWIELLASPVKDNWRGLRNATESHVIAALQGASSEAPFTVRRLTRTSFRRVSYG